MRRATQKEISAWSSFCAELGCKDQAWEQKKAAFIAKKDAERAEMRAERGQGYVRCADHRNGGATFCPRGGAALQQWQRRQWGE